MKQILQSLKTGTVELADVPCPAPGRGQILIQTAMTLVSAGTERMLVDFGKAGWLDKARQQPDKVRMVLEKVRTDGLMPTLEAVRNRLGIDGPAGAGAGAIDLDGQPVRIALQSADGWTVVAMDRPVAGAGCGAGREAPCR